MILDPNPAILAQQAIEFNTVMWQAFTLRLLAAAVIFAVGFLAAKFLQGVAESTAGRAGWAHPKQAATACFSAVMLLVAIAALRPLGIRYELLEDVLLVGFSAAAFGLALAAGLGGRDVLSGILAGYFVRRRFQSGDQVTVAEVEGTVREVGPVATIIETETGGMSHRRSVPNSTMLRDAVR